MLVPIQPPKRNRLFILLSHLFLVVACSETNDERKLMTVQGEISVEEMGLALVHEHILVDWIGADSTGDHRWEKIDVIQRALPFLMEAKELGVHTMLECSPAYLGRDPLILRELSKKTGINILTNTGYYGVVNNKFIPAHAFAAESADLANVWIDEFNNGIDETGIRPGFIKISVDREGDLSSMHAKLVQAAGITHLNTGLTIVSHTGPDGPAFSQLEILDSMGISPSAFVWTHAQQGTLEGQIRAAKKGAWISLDNVGQTSPEHPHKPLNIRWFVDRLTALKKVNVLNKVVISHDAGWYSVGEENGGSYRGYSDLINYLIPALLENAFTQEDVDLLLIENPKNAYALQVRTMTD